MPHSCRNRPEAEPTGGGGETAAPLETRGLAYDVTSTWFLVYGQTVRINGVSVAPFGATLVNGATVEVDFVAQPGGQNVATAINIDR